MRRSLKTVKKSHHYLKAPYCTKFLLPVFSNNNLYPVNSPKFILCCLLCIYRKCMLKYSALCDVTINSQCVHWSSE